MYLPCTRPWAQSKTKMKKIKEKMAPLVNTVAIVSDTLSLSLKIYIVERTDSHKLSSDIHTRNVACVYLLACAHTLTHTHINKYNSKNNKTKINV